MCHRIVTSDSKSEESESDKKDRDADSTADVSDPVRRKCKQHY